MSASMYQISRSTHLKIVIVGSTAAMIVVAIAANAQSHDSFRPIARTAPAVVVMPPQRPQIIPPRMAPTHGFASLAGAAKAERYPS
jgi:hypothetical protein